MEKAKASLNVPFAILAGALMVSISILISGGVIKLGGGTAVKIPVPSASPVPVVKEQPSDTTVNLAQIKDTFNKAQIKFGDSESKLIFIEVADPSCPYCHIASGKNPELNKQAGSRFTLVSDGGSYIPPIPEIVKLISDGKASFAWIYTSGHGNGELGTKGLYCAFEKGKFWEVHDLLMSKEGYELLNNTVKNDKSKSGIFADFFRSVIDPAVLKDCIDSGKYENRPLEDAKLAEGINISGTPGFYINNTLFAGAYNYKDMEPAVKAALGI